MRRLAILCNESAGRVDAIRDYSFHLAGGIQQRGAAADVWLRRSDGAWHSSVQPDESDGRPEQLSLDPEKYDALAIQYNPFMYGKWGFAPWLPLMLRRLKRRSPRTRIGLMVHEPYVPMVNWKWMLMGAWQRTQLEACRIGADLVFASIEAWADVLRSRTPFRPSLHLPVGSNLPDRRDARGAMRQRLNLTDDHVVLASLSTSSAGRLEGHLVGAVNAVAAASANVTLLNLGAGAPKPRGLAGSVQLHQPGRLSYEELASWLSAADLFLAPFVDGVSTRRGSLMAALQHGLPVVGTDGSLTDDVLAQARDALLLVPVDRSDRFAEAVVELAQARADAASVGQRGRLLYQTRFDWPIVAGSLLEAFEVDSNRAHATP
jgi:glycosyltransferase involved in cell wall biosynthesis